ncbi:hypothetical protein [Clostridium cellulovorans]|uniref:HesB/YadR/YfhF-family protein n=1 Tax=Clostridium cellulovorans (strain ATCC 35296 / DSM 3052 / OCM 3 / 743B) TaxID=573061 RepID=D9SX06_CLOC7|nr:hypothetical protein [Clostridium cellulovorans]ADL51367.1 hypothetical protein Clocel_1620 [Clostridium cellulovorans 743B]
MRDTRFEISDRAYIELQTLLNEHIEYSYVNFRSISSCCKPKVDIMLNDTKSEDDIVITYKDLQITFSPNDFKDIKSITLIYVDNFEIKIDKFDDIKKDCANCSSKGSCGSKTTNGCGGCKSC